MLARFISVAVVLGVAMTLLNFNLASAQTNTQHDAIAGDDAGAIAGDQTVQLEKTVSVEDAIAMASSGVSPQLIINQIRSSGVQQAIGVSEIIKLHKSGVSEMVINEMQRSSVGRPAPTTMVTQQPAIDVTRAVVVETAPAVVTRPQPTISFEHHGSVNRSHRGYHPARGSNAYHGPRRAAYDRQTFYR